MNNKELWVLLAKLRQQKFIDLTHAFFPGIPHASDMPDQEFITLYDFPTDGFRAHVYKHAGQWGTHVDPPIHFIEGGRAIDEIDVSEMLLPRVKFDCKHKSEANYDYIFALDDLKEWESIYGPVPDNAFAIMSTGWAKFWPSGDLMTKKDNKGVAHFPGWGKDAVEFLISERNVKAFGHETTDTDGGMAISADDYSVETLILKKNCYQIELLADTSMVPPVGAIASVTFPKPKGGSGYPARVFAICPA